MSASQAHPYVFISLQTAANLPLSVGVELHSPVDYAGFTLEKAIATCPHSGYAYRINFVSQLECLGQQRDRSILRISILAATNSDG